MTAYLDHNATSPLRPQARDAMVAALAECGNPSSPHAAGRAVRARVEAARRRIAAAFDMPSDAIVFTSGGTEANNLALRGTGAVTVLVSGIEHDSVLEAAPRAERIPVDGNGVVDLAWLEARLATGGVGLVSVMLANNETGVIQPVAEITRLAHREGALVHADATQAAGRIPVSFTDLDVELMTISAHKLGGPPGIGALLMQEGFPLRPLLRGGRQENGLRAGTENAPAIAGFAAAVDAAAAPDAGVGVLRDRLEGLLLAAVPEATIFGRAAERLPNTIAVAMPGVPAETQVMALDLAGVAVSAGAACSSGKVRTSPVLAAMGVDAALARQAIRISLGWNSTADDVARCADAWGALWARAAGRARAAA
ncbi:cysteine desulfurase [Stella humosa]|uniref:Cysteine desulfurase n=1 Tax=Stella humosa TaxID=94 RepID=A0A3N1M0R8_9PROT|nr:cysteine desulfurase family protein [Stella humosa]ROQ01094.1 cysteine desulfurase [Stella humosa]BBK31466.1 cysteine desulfurase [Stella humosa]